MGLGREAAELFLPWCPQEVLQSLYRTKSFLFVGCGETLRDQIFQALFLYAVPDKGDLEHYMVVLKDSEDHFFKHQADMLLHGVKVLSYGARFEHFPGYVQDLAAQICRRRSPEPPRPPGQAPQGLAGSSFPGSYFRDRYIAQISVIFQRRVCTLQTGVGVTAAARPEPVRGAAPWFCPGARVRVAAGRHRQQLPRAPAQPGACDASHSTLPHAAGHAASAPGCTLLVAPRPSGCWSARSDQDR